VLGVFVFVIGSFHAGNIILSKVPFLFVRNNHFANTQII
jgi:hypothetical protein